MRPIKFRGKCCHSDAWAYGNLVDYGEDEYPEIQGFDVFRENDDVWKEPIVERDTIGQFTGLYDKNGEEIYEGDIIKHGTFIGVVDWHPIGNFFINENYGKRQDKCISLGEMLENHSFIVVGNIHDNPELLKGGKHESK